MSILGAESYAAVCHLVTDIKALSTEERSRVLWYACDGGDLSMVKSVIRAGCDVDHFHRGHTPLMMASIRGHDDVVKELILAGCKVDLQSSKCSVGWFGFITRMASAWSWVVLVMLAVMIRLMVMASNYGVRGMVIVTFNFTTYVLLHVLMVMAFQQLHFKTSQMLRLKTKIKYMVGIVLLVVHALVWRVIVTSKSGFFLSVVMVMTGPLAMVVAKVCKSAMVAYVVAVAGAVVVVVIVFKDTVRAAVVGVASSLAWSKLGAQKEAVVYGFVQCLLAGFGFTVIVYSSEPMAVSILKPITGITIMTAVLNFAAITADIAGLTSDTSIIFFDVLGALSLSALMLFVLPTFGTINRMITSFFTTGMTALHYAAWYNHITCGAHLVEAGANVQAENRYFRTPLSICSRRFRAAVKQAQSHPPKQVIAVIGNTEYGKSTLIAALQSESRTLFQILFCKLSQVYNIIKRTAGIETVTFSSAKYGRVLFYDFAGQSDYHGPHQPFLEAMLSKPGVTVTVLLLVKVSEERDVITQQLRRWLQPLALARTSPTPHVIVVGSFLDQVKSKNLAANVQRLQGCIDSVQDEYPSLKVQELFLLDCREPESAGINGLRSYLQQTLPPHSTSRALYNVHWVMAQLQKAFSGKSLQLTSFSVWLRDNARDLPTHLPSAEDVCQDLSAAGYILFLRNKQDLSQSWLVLDLQTILHNVYGTLFSPNRAVVNQFGLLHCTHLSELFPNLDPTMIQEVLITLEFCIRIDPLLLKEEMLSLTEQDEVKGWLYFPALVEAEAGEVFEQDQQCLHWACWQLKTNDSHIFPAHLLQGILLHLAATHVFIEKELPHSVRRHCCSVWVNGLSWGSTTGVDVAVQISDSRVVQVIGRSREGPGELYGYLCSVTQSIFKTIARLSPALKATPYIIHPYTYIGLDESVPSPPTTRYPVASIVGSIEAGHKYVHSLPISRGSGSSRVSLQELFGGWSPSLTVVQCLKEAQKDLSE